MCVHPVLRGLIGWDLSAFDFHNVKFAALDTYDVNFYVGIPPISCQNGVPVAFKKFGGSLFAFPPDGIPVVSQSFTTVTPAPPFLMSSSLAVMPGIVRRYFWISSLRTPVPFPWIMRTVPMFSMMASSI